MFLLGIFQATRPRSPGRELVQCAAFAMNFRFEFFVGVSPGDLSGDAPKILRSGTRTVSAMNVRFEIFECVSPGDLSGDAPKILRSGTRTVCRVRDKFSL